MFHTVRSFTGGSAVKNLPAKAGAAGLIPGVGRSPRGGNGNHYSVLPGIIPWTEEPGSHGVAKEWDMTHRLTNNIWLGRKAGREGEEDRKEGIFPLSGLLGEVAPAPAVRTHRPAVPCGR